MILSFILFLALSTNSCKVTELDPINTFPATNVYTSKSTIQLAVTGMYDAAQSGFYDPLNGTALAVRGYPFGAASIEQGDMRGQDMVNVAAFFQLTYNGTYNANTANNVNMWSTLYALINQCNDVIEGVQGATGILTAAEINIYVAEARFLRALAYHELLIHFARPFTLDNGASPGVVIRDFVINTPEKTQKAALLKRSTVAECYTFLLADLDFAEANLPARGATTPVSRLGALGVTRATTGAAIALKTRVKLHKGDWAGVLTDGVKIATQITLPFSGGGYSLTAAADGPFANNQSAESIFSFENAATDNPGVNGGLASMYTAPPTGRALICVSPLIWNQTFWLASDTRRSLLTTLVSGTYYTTKYKDPGNRSDFTPIIRYAEVLLNMAEAEARANGLNAKGVDLLNAVRNRGVGVASAFTLASFVDANALLTAIYNERRIEFLAEGRAWADIHRRNLPIPAKASAAAATGTGYNTASGTFPTGTAALSIPFNDFRYLWPIPALEIANNPNVTQNPGW